MLKHTVESIIVEVFHGMQHLSNILSLISLRMEQCRFSPVDPAESGEITRSEVEKKGV